MKPVYKWRPYANVPVAAQVAGEELERIRVENNGRLSQETYVAEARDKKSPLHPTLEWDDKKAAHRYRLTQAGYVIRMLSVTYVSEQGVGSEPVRAFVNVSRDEDRSYTSIAHAMSDEELRKQVIARAFKELQDWRNRYSELVEFASVFAAIEQVREAA